jgi:hypothetical protein
MDPIKKTVFKVTVLHYADEDAADMELEHVLDEMNIGSMVGKVEVQSTVAVSPEKVKFELKAVGNDGTFFDDEGEVP